MNGTIINNNDLITFFEEKHQTVLLIPFSRNKVKFKENNEAIANAFGSHLSASIVWHSSSENHLLFIEA